MPGHDRQSLCCILQLVHRFQTNRPYLAFAPPPQRAPLRPPPRPRFTPVAYPYASPATPIPPALRAPPPPSAGIVLAAVSRGGESQNPVFQACPGTGPWWLSPRGGDREGLVPSPGKMAARPSPSPIPPALALPPLSGARAVRAIPGGKPCPGAAAEPVSREDREERARIWFFPGISRAVDRGDIAMGGGREVRDRKSRHDAPGERTGVSVQAPVFQDDLNFRITPGKRTGITGRMSRSAVYRCGRGGEIREAIPAN